MKRMFSESLSSQHSCCWKTSRFVNIVCNLSIFILCISQTNGQYGPEYRPGQGGVYPPPGHAGRYPGGYNGPYDRRPFDSRYDTRFDPRNPYENRYHGINYEEHIKRVSDSRCNLITLEHLPLVKNVETPYGAFEGNVVYLCDTPTTKREDRPLEQGGIGQPRKEYPASAVAFLGIPYAAPPLGVYRFRDPQPLPAAGNMPAKEFGSSCLQHTNYTGVSKGIDRVNEDCLFLNVYTPNDEYNRGQKYAVMVYIHDGDFSHGSGNTFPGHMLAATQDVIVVTLNYRLGALGFLATGDNSSAGNFGLLDQRAAINWVYHSIDRFGGDPEKITLFGPGAGAASAGIHMIQQIYGEDLHIRRVIAMSGSPTADWAAIDDVLFVRNVSRRFGDQIGCYATNSWNLVECLKRKSNNSVEFTLTDVKPDRGWLPWGPVIDRNTRYKLPAMPHVPLEYLEHKVPRPDRLRNIQYMTGVSVNDASFMATKDEALQNIGFQMTKEEFEFRLKQYAKTYNYTINEAAIVDAIKFMYTPPTDPHNSTLLMEEFVNMYTDSLYVAPMDKMVKLLLEIGVPVYQYVMNYSLTSDYFVRSHREWDRMPHDIESYLVSGAPFMDPKFYPSSLDFAKVRWSDGDRNMSQFFMEAWANFAKEGTPTPNALFGVIDWKPMAKNNLQYLSINATYYEVYNASSFMFRDYRQKQSQFWNEYIPTIFGRPEHYWPYWYELPWEYENRVYRTSLYFVSGMAGLFLLLAFIGFCCYCRSSRYKDDLHDEASSDKTSSLIPIHQSSPIPTISNTNTRHVRFAE